MNNDSNFDSGHLQIRNGMLDHLAEGKMTPDMFTAYYLMLARCNFATGIWHGSAERLVAETGGVWSKPTAVRILKRLIDGGYITSEHQRGKRGNYDLLIANYVPTIGADKGKRLRPRAASEITGDSASEEVDSKVKSPMIVLSESEVTSDSTSAKVKSKVKSPVSRVQEGVQEIETKKEQQPVSKKESKGVPDGTPSVVTNAKLNPVTDREQDYLKALGIPVVQEQVLALRTFLKTWTETELWNFWHWNQRHKTGRLQFMDLSDALHSLDSDSKRSAMKQWQKHDTNPAACPKHCDFVPMPALAGDDDILWDKLVRLDLVGNVGVKWYFGLSPDEAVVGYPDKEACLKDFYENQNGLRGKLLDLITYAEGGYVQWLGGWKDVQDEPKAAFEIEDDIDMQLCCKCGKFHVLDGSGCPEDEDSSFCSECNKSHNGYACPKWKPEPEPCYICKKCPENKRKICAWHKDFLARIEDCPDCTPLEKGQHQLCEVHADENAEHKRCPPTPAHPPQAGVRD
jgi:hypothetical protein